MDIYAALLAAVPGLGSRHVRGLIEHFGTAEKAWKASPEAWGAAGLAGEKVIRQARIFRMHENEDSYRQKLADLGAGVCTWRDPLYPALLRETADPPAVLFFRGTLERDEKSIAIVGSRKSTPAGLYTAESFGRELAEAGVTVVSGGARGADSAAHRGALKGKGRTVAVTACGPDFTYPPENKNLFEEICSSGGAVITEFPPGTPPLKRHFPARNRIIAGMSAGLLVTEAARRSGTLITADFALEEGRDVFAVPGSIWSEMSTGTNGLIRNGAFCTVSADSVLEEYGWNSAKKEGKKEKQELTLEEEMVYRFCSMDNMTSEEELLEQTHLPIHRLSMILLSLQMKGMLRDMGTGRFAAVPRNRP